MKLPLSFLILIACYIPCFSQKPCYLSLADAPVIRDVKLGMTHSEIEKILGIKINLTDIEETSYYLENPEPTSRGKGLLHQFKYKFGAKSFFYDYTNMSSNKLDGIESILLKFFDDSLYLIFIRYKKQSFDWKDSMEIANIISEKFNLPKDSWRTSKTGSYLFCSGFSVTATFGNDGNTVLGLSDSKTEDLLKIKETEAKSKAEKELKDSILEKKRSFKP